MCLGVYAHQIRTRGLFADRRDKLTQLGFIYNKADFKVKVVMTPKYQRIIDALVAYKQQHNHLLMTLNYVIAQNDTHFPPHTWGLRLGAAVINLRRYPKRCPPEPLNAIGFDWKVSNLTHYNRQTTFNRFFNALQVYKSIHHNLQIPVHYKIPQNDTNYPSESWGMYLGRALRHVRRRGSYPEHHQKLSDLGVEFDPSIFMDKSPKPALTFESIYSALLVYKSIHGDCMVTPKYHIAKGDDRYAQEARGMHLGNIVESMRSGGIHVCFI
jgi:hypothetical protein